MDDIEAEIYGRRWDMRGIDQESYGRNVGPQAFLPFARSNPCPPTRQSMLSQRPEATYTRTKRQQSFYQNRTSLTVPRALDPSPSTYSDYSGHAVLPEPSSQPNGDSGGTNGDLSAVRPYALPLNRDQDRNWPSDQQTRPFRFYNPVSTSFRSLGGIAANVHTPLVVKSNTLSSPISQLSSPCAGVSRRRTSQNARPIGAGVTKARDFPSISSKKRQIPPGDRGARYDHPPPTVQGIRLVSLNDLPDRFRSVFPYPVFNAIQSKCFIPVYGSNDNLVVSAPTGGGKTAILELAICRLVSDSRSHQYKVVYMAPTKSLCSERHRDWQSKFASLDLECAELTGDTDKTQLQHVQHASVIITTPEKWDSMTRKWKDHIKLMQLVKLFLIDEVHILRDTRGAILEAVVSRMKSIGTKVRFLALSATIPNSEDIAIWLGRDSNNQRLPAQREVFGEEFRPVKLQKFVYGLSYTGNDFGFEKYCDNKLPEIIERHSQGKPIMIFCMTRKSTIATAKLLADLWMSRGTQDPLWPHPNLRIAVEDPDLRNILQFGVAFHHAGLDTSDRLAVEKGFLEGQISVICCTSTLAVGVNLPCHLVIIKNTMSFQDEGLKEYADLEIMQMLGRAGRPQFDDTAVAAIITKQQKVEKYEKLASGEELLESCLHLNLIDHLNAEIGLGTIHDIDSAKRWLEGTFLFVRLGKNPNHYRIDGDSVEKCLNDRIERICQRDINLLYETNLVTSDTTFKSTEFGDAMARYYIRFETMQKLLGLQRQARMSEILSALAGAEEFHDIRLRGGEKKLYKEINASNAIKFPIKVDIALPDHKRSLIMQAELGGLDFPADEHYAKHRKQYHQDKVIIFSHIHRLIKCIIDCQIHVENAVTVRHALELLRSFSARAWDNSPYQMKQIPQIGPVAIRKLVNGGINSIEALEATEAHRIEMLMIKNPPFGTRLLANLKEFPKLWVSVKMMGKDAQRGVSVDVKIKIQLGFLNEKVPNTFHRKQLFISLLTERSDGILIDFRRMSARNVSSKDDILLSANMLHHSQYITCYVMCDEIAGTMRSAELKPELPASMFPRRLINQEQQHGAISKISNGLPRAKNQRRTTTDIATSRSIQRDEFPDDEINDQDLIAAADATTFKNIEEFDSSMSLAKEASEQKQFSAEQGNGSWNPRQLENGKWACNHRCKDKAACKHLCCREGVEKAPKAPKGLTNSGTSSEYLAGSVNKKRAKPIPRPPPVTQEHRRVIQAIDLSCGGDQDDYAQKGPHEYRKLHKLHTSVNKGPSVPIIANKTPTFSYTIGSPPQLSFLNPSVTSANRSEKPSSDYDDSWMDDFPSPSLFLDRNRSHDKAPAETNIPQAGDTAVSDGDPACHADYEDKCDSTSLLRNEKPQTVDLEVQHSRPDRRERSAPPLPKLSMFVSEKWEGMTSAKSDDRSFCSTDGPEKMNSLPEQDELTSSPGILQPKETPDTGRRSRTVTPQICRYASKDDFHLPKKRRIGLISNEHVPPVPSDNQGQPRSPMEDGEPTSQSRLRSTSAWADKLDSGFVAERADFVDLT